MTITEETNVGASICVGQLRSNTIGYVEQVLPGEASTWAAKASGSTSKSCACARDVVSIESRRARHFGSSGTTVP